MKRTRTQNILLPLAAALLSGSLVAWLNPAVRPASAFLAGFVLGGAGGLLLVWVCRKLNVPRLAGWLTAIAFVLRLALGAALYAALPVWGYNEAPPNAGYLYLDAYKRDADAWHLASSGDSLLSAFSDEFRSDQYGGLLSLSAGVYRALSPDAHRPLLVLILTAFFNALGLPFLWKAVSRRWDEKIANTTAWVYALYPESVILGASQMREPILIGLSAMVFWGTIEWGRNRKTAVLAMLLGTAGMVFISLKASAAILLGMAIWFWLQNLLPHIAPKWRTLSTLALLALILAGLALSWGWLLDSAKWDLFLMESSSGRIQWELKLAGGRFRVPFIVGYGLAQPVLPAAIMYPGIPIMRAISIFRAFGWYALVPLLLAGFLQVWKLPEKREKAAILLFFALALAWTLISSARAGGDQWDNPRYRALFMVWMALLAGWSWAQVLRSRSPWLWRLLVLEVFYIGFFIHWYLSRYYEIFKRMDFWPMVTLLAGAGGAVIFGGILYDLISARTRRKKGA